MIDDLPWRAHASWVPLLLLLLLLASCHGAATPRAPATTVPMPTAIPVGQAKALPPIDLSRFSEEVVRKHIEAELAVLDAARSKPQITSSALSDTFGQVGMVLMAYDLDAGAMAAMSDAVALQPDARRWTYYLAQLHKRRGEMPQALALFERIREKHPDDLLAAIHTAGAYQALERHDEAMALAHQITLQHGEIPVVMLMRAEDAVQRGDQDEAIAAYKRVLQVQPSASIIHYQLAQIYRQKGDVKQAEVHLAQQGKGQVDIEDPLLAAVRDLNRSVHGLVSRGDLQVEKGRTDSAAALYRKALETDPTLVEARVKLGQVSETLGDPDAAVEQYRWVLTHSEPGDLAKNRERNSQLLQQIGRIEAKRQQGAKAEAAFREAMQVDPENAGAVGDLANLLRVTGRCADAMPYFDQGIAGQPQLLLLRIHAVLCHTELGQHRQALAVLEAAHAQEPANPDVVDALARVLAASAAIEVRDGQRALALATHAAQQRQSVDRLETLAMAQAETGDFSAAIQTQKLAIDAATTAKQDEWQRALVANMVRYQAGQAAREPWPAFLYRR